MLLTLDNNDALYQIRAYTHDYFMINNERITSSLIVSAQQLIAPWGPRCLAELSAEHLLQVLPLEPEIILLGCGMHLQFPDAKLLAPLRATGISVEIMSSGAACRTFAVLQAEYRRVAAMLLLHA